MTLRNTPDRYGSISSGRHGRMPALPIGAHALAALFHHDIARDDTLLRMLPGKA